MFERQILDYLRRWALRENRKPLILRGARQVGKTTAVNMFSAEFDQYLYMNLEIGEDRNVFRQDLSFQEIVQALFFLKNKVRKRKKTLIFIDEIQNSPEAVRRLREFYEFAPELYVIAAGSLLETLISKQIHFPVGRVEFFYMYPLTFREFLQAMEEEAALKTLNTIPFPQFAHNRLLKLFYQYVLIGGMPEIVENYIKHQDLVSLNPIYEALLVSYLDDVEKYARGHASAHVIRRVIRSSFYEAGTRIRFEGFGQSRYRSREIGEALRTLEKTMLLRLIYPTTSVNTPIVPDLRKAPKLQVLDTGLVNYFVGLQKEIFGTRELNAVYEGRIAEHIVGQELIAQRESAIQEISFWVRGKKQSSAEVDFLAAHENLLIPVEVKSGKAGRLRSLFQFMEKAPHPYAVRIYSGPLQVDEIALIGAKPFLLLNLPFFLVGELNQYLGWLTAKYPEFKGP
ncbi:MAG: ATP-binding protein [Deltaproteobacteria bacterium]|nr:ATP-binding protein [Deltaproteobacteria bacterium]